MKHLLLILIIITALALPLLAQEDGLQLIDEFGWANDEIRLVRTDNFAVQLQNQPDKIALINISGGRDRSPSFNYLFGALFRAQMINQSKIDRSRIEIQNCSVNEPEIRVRFYIAAKNAVRPACDPGPPSIEKTSYFGTAYNESDGTDVGCCEVVGSSEAILEAFERVIVDVLKKDPGASVTMIGYSGTNTSSSENAPVKARIVTRKWRKWDSPLIVANMTKAIAARFRENGIARNRINIVVGGYKDYRSHVDFWIVPAGGEKPTPKPDFVIKTAAKGSKSRVGR